MNIRTIYLKNAVGFFDANGVRRFGRKVEPQSGAAEVNAQDPFSLELITEPGVWIRDSGGEIFIPMSNVASIEFGT